MFSEAADIIEVQRAKIDRLMSLLEDCDTLLHAVAADSSVYTEEGGLRERIDQEFCRGPSPLSRVNSTFLATIAQAKKRYCERIEEERPCTTPKPEVA